MAVIDFAGELPTKEPLVVWSPSTHPLAKSLPQPNINPRWQRFFSDNQTENAKKATRRASILLPDQGAALGLAALPIGSVGAGLWRVSYFLRISRPATVSSNVALTINFTHRAVVLAFIGAALNANLITTWQFGTVILRVDADTPISYSTVYATAGATPMRYDLEIAAEDVALDGAA